VQLQHRFTVPAPVETAWEALNDVKSVGECFPGATVTSVEGEEFSGTCKIKLGPISMQYAGSGKFLERDESAHRAVLEAKGRDKRGNGTAAVTVTTVLTPEAEDRTAVSVDTDLNITGKPAQFGRGVIQDVSDKLLGQFTDCLESKIGTADETSAAAESAPASVPESGSTTQTPPQPATETPPASSGSSGSTASASSGSSGSGSSQESALDLGATVLPVLAKRYGPYALGALAVLFVLWRVLRR
jgi:carbon monoxide dehydrogenase subunit G